ARIHRRKPSGVIDVMVAVASPRGSLQLGGLAAGRIGHLLRFAESGEKRCGGSAFNECASLHHGPSREPNGSGARAKARARCAPLVRDLILVGADCTSISSIRATIRPHQPDRNFYGDCWSVSKKCYHPGQSRARPVNSLQLGGSAVRALKISAAVFAGVLLAAPSMAQ